VKRLLVIANLHHASPRIPALLTPLAELGWKIKVVTPPLGEDAESLLGLPAGFFARVEIAEAPYRGDIFRFWRKVLHLLGFSSRRSYTEQIKERVGGGGQGGIVDVLMRAYQTLFAIPDTEWPWHHSAWKTANTLLSMENYDVMLSSSPFPTVHRVGARLADRYSIPWVADFRDPWSQNHSYSLPKFRNRLDRWLEIRTLRGAALITTVSSGFADKLAQLHRQEILVIRNGFQPVADRSNVALPERFTISYTGNIYAGKQDPSKVLRALRNFIDSGEVAENRVALNFYGRYDSALQQFIVEQGLERVAVQQGSLPRAESRLRQRASHLLLLLQWEDLDERGIFPLKFYEYLDAGRPILATGGSGSDEICAVLAETHAGACAVNVPEVEVVLRRAYQGYLAGDVPDYQAIPDAIARYSYTGIARHLADCLERVSLIGQRKEE